MDVIGRLMWPEESSCHGKERFVNAAVAHNALRRRSYKGRPKGAKPGQAYHCRYCGGYHIGAIIKPRRQERYHGRDDEDDDWDQQESCSWG